MIKCFFLDKLKKDFILYSYFFGKSQRFVRNLFTEKRYAQKTIIGSLHVAESDVAKEEQARVVGAGGAAVVSGLGDHVGEVDAFTEHVAGHGSLGRSDAETLEKKKKMMKNALRFFFIINLIARFKESHLRENSSKVGGPGAVPEQHAVTVLFEGLIFGLFPIPAYLENLKKKILRHIKFYVKRWHVNNNGQVIPDIVFFLTCSISRLYMLCVAACVFLT